MNIIPARAEDVVVTDREIDCSSFSARAHSLQYEAEFGIFLKSQETRIFRKRSRVTVIIQTYQHWSPNKNLIGLKVLDDEADNWFCLKTNTGKHYILVGFTCNNEDWTSCRYNTERGELYDYNGRNMHLDRMSDAQANALLKRLGLPLAPPDGGIVTQAHKILF